MANGNVVPVGNVIYVDDPNDVVLSSGAVAFVRGDLTAWTGSTNGNVQIWVPPGFQGIYPEAANLPANPLSPAWAVTEDATAYEFVAGEWVDRGQLQGAVNAVGPAGPGINVLPPVLNATARLSLAAVDYDTVYQNDTGEWWMKQDGAWTLIGVIGGSGGGGGGDTSTYGSHVVTWNGTVWRFRNTTITSRPAVGTYASGSFIIWDSSLYVDAPYPSLAVAGDKWYPHPDLVV